VRRIHVLLALALLPVAGCLDLGGGEDRPDYKQVQDEVALDAARVLLQDHGKADGHADAALHRGGMNLEPVGYHNGVDDSGEPDRIPAQGYYTELAVTRNYAYLTRHSLDGSYGGFSIIDIRNPSSPAYVGGFSALGGADIEVSDDERLAFFATQRNTPEELAGHGMAYQEPSTPRGIVIVDISDKAFPEQAGFQPLPVNGPHTLSYLRHTDGGEYLLVCTYDLVTDPGTGAIVGAVPVTQRVLVYRIERVPSSPVGPLPVDGVVLVPVSQFQLTDSPPQGRLFFPHDAVPQVHPDGRVLLYVAYWDKGVQIVDISDPASPVHVSGFTEFSPSSRNNVHQVRPFDEPIGGRHVTVTEPEIIAADETGHFFFLDTTEPESPEKLGHWTLPGDLIVQSLEFSPHNFDTWDGKVALAHNHAGLWVVDVGDEENLREPKTAAYYMPTPSRAESPRPQPYVWGVFEQRTAQGSLLFASDEATGLHILRYTGP